MKCTECGNYGYQKDNGQHVCKWGLNFNYKANCYDVEYACYCKKFQKITLLGVPLETSYAIPPDFLFFWTAPGNRYGREN